MRGVVCASAGCCCARHLACLTARGSCWRLARVAAPAARSSHDQHDAAGVCVCVCRACRAGRHGYVPIAIRNGRGYSHSKGLSCWLLGGGGAEPRAGGAERVIRGGAGVGRLAGCAGYWLACWLAGWADRAAPHAHAGRRRRRRVCLPACLWTTACGLSALCCDTLGVPCTGRARHTAHTAHRGGGGVCVRVCVCARARVCRAPTRA